MFKDMDWKPAFGLVRNFTELKEKVNFQFSQT